MLDRAQCRYDERKKGESKSERIAMEAAPGEEGRWEMGAKQKNVNLKGKSEYLIGQREPSCTTPPAVLQQ